MAVFNTIDYQEEVIESMHSYSELVLINTVTSQKFSSANPIILLHAATGSGKTVIMARYISKLYDSITSSGDTDIRFAVVWLCVGQGGLVKQSQEKLSRFIGNKMKYKDSSDIIGGSKDMSLSHGDILFLGWEELNRTDKNNNATNILTREGTNINFGELMYNTHIRSINVILVIDESHIASESVKSQDIVKTIYPQLIINVTATPSTKLVKEVKRLEERSFNNTGLKLGLYAKVDTAKVINAGMIKKDLVINYGIKGELGLIQRKDQKQDTKNNDSGTSNNTSNNTSSPISVILNRAVDLRDHLEDLYITAKDFNDSVHDINPLVLIQISDADAGKEDEKEIVEFLKTKEIDFDNGSLACWYSDTKINIENIEKLDAPQKVLLFKTAIATGWDCPRACILVKFRDSSAENTPFLRQVVGRILRMPEQRHYNRRQFLELNKAYIFTNETSFSFKMDPDVDDSADATKYINIYKHSVTIQDKYDDIFNFSVKKPLPTYNIRGLKRELADDAMSIILQILNTDIEGMIKYGKEHQDELNAKVLYETSYGVDRLDAIGENNNSLTETGKMMLQASLIRRELGKIYDKSTNSLEARKLLESSLNEYRRFLCISRSDELNPRIKKGNKMVSTWANNDGANRFRAMLYTNKSNPNLNKGFTKDTGKDTEINYLEGYIRYIFSKVYVIPDHTISEDNLGEVMIPKNAVLEVVDSEDECYSDEGNNCLYGIMPCIKYRQLNEYLEENVIDNPDVEWWYPNWLGGGSQVVLPYKDAEGLLKTVRPEIIQCKNNTRIYTFVPSNYEKYYIACQAVENFKNICNDPTIDYEIVEPVAEQEEDFKDDMNVPYNYDENSFTDINDIGTMNSNNGEDSFYIPIEDSSNSDSGIKPESDSDDLSAIGFGDMGLKIP